MSQDSTRIKLALLCASLLLSNFCLAEPTLDQVRKVMVERSIPNWKKTATLAKEAIANPTNKSWKEIWQALDVEAAVGTGTKALARASNPRDASKLFANATWLRWKILSENADGRFEGITLLTNDATVAQYQGSIRLA